MEGNNSEGLNLKRLPLEFYTRTDVVQIARELLGKDEIVAGPHIGVDYAGASAAWSWRFWLKNSPFVKKQVELGNVCE